MFGVFSMLSVWGRENYRWFSNSQSLQQISKDKRLSF